MFFISSVVSYNCKVFSKSFLTFSEQSLQESSSHVILSPSKSDFDSSIQKILDGFNRVTDEVCQKRFFQNLSFNRFIWTMSKSS